MKKILGLTFVFVAVLNSIAFGWGTKGHDIIAGIAYKHLTPKAKKEIIRALEGRSMIYYATWLDKVRVLPEYKSTASWHYANVDEGQSYATMSKESDGDVYTATTEIIEKLSTRSKQHMSDSLEQFYVKALIHLVGDMHCPMHTGRRTDLGGNNFKIKWFNSPTSLHTVWDTKLLESSRSWSHSEWVDNIDYLSDDQIAAKYVYGDPLAWLNETIDIGKNIYLNANEGKNYSYDYIRQYSSVLEEQLLRAGYRLAQVLNQIYK